MGMHLGNVPILADIADFIANSFIFLVNRVAIISERYLKRR
jgi:hypothetical protein